MTSDSSYSKYGLKASKFSFLDFSMLLEIIDVKQEDVKAKLEAIREAKSSISIADMFDMQMRMNKLSQFSEMCTSIVGASNTALLSMARNLKQ